MGPEPRINNRELVNDLYWNKGLSLEKCGKQLGLSLAGMWKTMRRLKIPMRSMGSGRRGKTKGRTRHSGGYINLYLPEHPRAKPKHPYVLEHIIVMERYLGRYLRPEERVHHKNGDRADNHIENLELCENQAEHVREHHHIGRWARKYDCCLRCNTTEREHGARGYCIRCYNWLLIHNAFSE